jgi:hypothetical protein
MECRKRRRQSVKRIGTKSRWAGTNGMALCGAMSSRPRWMSGNAAGQHRVQHITERFRADPRSTGRPMKQSTPRLPASASSLQIRRRSGLWHTAGQCRPSRRHHPDAPPAEVALDSLPHTVLARSSHVAGGLMREFPEMRSCFVFAKTKQESPLQHEAHQTECQTILSVFSDRNNLVILFVRYFQFNFDDRSVSDR